MPSSKHWISLVVAATLLLVACGNDEHKATTPGAEPTAGSWQTWVLSNASEIAVPAPPAPDSAAARADAAALKRAAATRTPAQAAAARRAAAGSPIQPWMNVNFELVANRAKNPVAAS